MVSFNRCLDSLMASRGNDSSVRYFAMALLRPVNRQFITTERIQGKNTIICSFPSSHHVNKNII
jgi:hypothetical protein